MEVKSLQWTTEVEEKGAECNRFEFRSGRSSRDQSIRGVHRWPLYRGRP